MKKILLSSVLALAAAATVSAPALCRVGQHRDRIAGTAVANIVSAITLIHTPGTSLNFGTFRHRHRRQRRGDTSAGVGSTTGDVAFVTGTIEAADQFLVKGDGPRAPSRFPPPPAP